MFGGALGFPLAQGCTPESFLCAPPESFLCWAALIVWANIEFCLPENDPQRRFQVRIMNLTEVKSMRDLNPKDIDTLVAVQGMVCCLALFVIRSIRCTARYESCTCWRFRLCAAPPSSRI
eukprot:SAG31_NODE_9078_length_1339_cov_1.083065_2_plen_120_part_00